MAEFIHKTGQLDDSESVVKLLGLQQFLYLNVYGILKVECTDVESGSVGRHVPCLAEFTTK